MHSSITVVLVWDTDLFQNCHFNFWFVLIQGSFISNLIYNLHLESSASVIIPLLCQDGSTCGAGMATSRISISHSPPEVMLQQWTEQDSSTNIPSVP